MTAEPLAYAPVVVGLVEVAKRLGLPARWAPLAAVGLGVGVGVAALGVGRDGAVAGVLIGLSAAGLYSSVKTTAEVKPRA